MYSRYKLNPSMSKIKISYNKFAGINADAGDFDSSLSYSPMSYNFSFDYGRLNNGMGVRILHAPLTVFDQYPETIFGQATNSDNFDIEKAWFFNSYIDGATFGDDSGIMYYTSNGEMYFSTLYSGLEPEKTRMTFSSPPSVTQYRLYGDDVLIICGDNKMYTWTWQGDEKLIEGAPMISSMCVHNERLFVTVADDPNTVWYSDDLDPTNWNVSSNEAGFITIVEDRGRINKVLSYNDYVYVFRDFGISRIYAQGGEENFYIQELYHSDSIINANTVSICGNTMYLVIGNSLYSFDGLNYHKIECGLEKYLPNGYKQAVSAFNNGKYYLATKFEFDDNKQIGDELINSQTNNVLIEFDTNTGVINIMRGKSIKHILSVEHHTMNKLVLCTLEDSQTHFRLHELTHDGKFYDTYTKKYFTGMYTSCGYPNKTKILQEIDIKTQGDIKIYVNCDGDAFEYALKGSDKIQKVMANRKFEVLKIDFESNASALISPPTLIVGVLWKNQKVKSHTIA